MRKTKEDKALSHQGIVAQAAHLFRERGIEQTSVADIMQAAKMTHGGFYRHFQSKDDLVVAALEAAVGEFLAELGQEPAKSVSPTVVDDFTAKYLSDGHVDNPRIGCPIAALAVDAGRMGGRVAAKAADSIKRVIAAIAAHLPGYKQAAHDRSAVMFATMVGAVVIARASGDSEIGKEVLAACRKRLVV